VKKMASTFKALADVADFKKVEAPAAAAPAEEPVESPALEQQAFWKLYDEAAFQAAKDAWTPLSEL
jgi:hypothetical protein